ncbi:hypothetical protein QO010_003585 [Caulobacter ginsengisoli]|uniref:Uncharacterized protein n=1 Tax=Caulobacter ginsengisoli TaxID=400775 RepID=A0ABU0IX78_9CAUL|nr:hypothetical protein [Caulobacter ginsengisoli]MDQ0465793.1 hypothetical protein [Caulobacter ginsengisoli]
MLLFGGVAPAVLGSQIDLLLLRLQDPLSQILHPILWPLHDLVGDAGQAWLMWLVWALRLVLWAGIGTITVGLVVWLTLCDHRGRAVNLSGAMAMLTRTFWPLLLIQLMFDVQNWGRPLAYLMPPANAWLFTDLILRLAVILFTAWFGVAASVVIEEGLGFRQALARSATLIRGRRLIVAGLCSGIALATEMIWKTIHGLVQLAYVRPLPAETALSYLLYDIPMVLALVFETVLYLEMRRLRDPFPNAPSGVSQ